MKTHTEYDFVASDTVESHELYSKFNSWMKAYTFIVQGKLKKIIELRRIVTNRTGEDFDSPESIIELCGCHPDTLDEYIRELEIKLIPHNDYQDKFNTLLDKLKELYPTDWYKMHPLYQTRENEIDWDLATEKLEKNLQ